MDRQPAHDQGKGNAHRQGSQPITPHNPGGRWLTAQQSAQLLNVPENTFRTWHAYGIYRACQASQPRRILYYADDVLDLHNLTKDADQPTLSLILHRLRKRSHGEP